MKIEDYLTGLVIGDALGTPLNNLSKGNIKANFKKIASFVDPWPAVKANPFKWKKPALYSAITQFSILIAFASSNRRYSQKDLFKLISLAPGIPDYQYRIFRHADHNLNNLIINIDENINTYEKNHLSSHILPLSATFILTNPEPTKLSLIDIFIFTLIFTDNPWNITLSLIYSFLIQNILCEKPEAYNLCNYIIKCITKLETEIESIFPQIFEKGISPDEITKIIRSSKNLFLDLNEGKDFVSANKTITRFFNNNFKMHITRPTIDHPLAVLGLSALYIKHFLSNPDQIIFYSAMEGGATQAICSTAISLAAFLFGKKIIDKTLPDTLINKKNIFSFIDIICTKKITSKNIESFIQNEALLTKKEIEEYNSRTKKLLKKNKFNKKKKKSSSDKANKLNQHVVESWTKIDKAKWKKEKERNKLIY